MDLDRFSVIDLDAYGVPLEQLEILLRRSWRRPCLNFCYSDRKCFCFRIGC